MEITRFQYEQIADCLPTQRGNVRLSNLYVLNAILYVAEHGCKWPGLPKRFGNWHTIYTRINRRSKKGVLDRVFERLQQFQMVRIKIEAVAIDSRPSIFTAIQELGLKLEAAKAPLEVLVIDSVQKPSENWPRYAAPDMDLFSSFS